MNRPNLINLHQKVFTDEDTIKQDSAWQTTDQGTLDMKETEPYANPYIKPDFKVKKNTGANTSTSAVTTTVQPTSTSTHPGASMAQPSS